MAFIFAVYLISVGAVSMPSLLNGFAAWPRGRWSSLPSIAFSNPRPFDVLWTRRIPPSFSPCSSLVWFWLFRTCIICCSRATQCFSIGTLHSSRVSSTSIVTAVHNSSSQRQTHGKNWSSTRLWWVPLSSIIDERWTRVFLPLLAVHLDIDSEYIHHQELILESDQQRTLEISFEKSNTPCDDDAVGLEHWLSGFGGTSADLLRDLLWSWTWNAIEWRVQIIYYPMQHLPMFYQYVLRSFVRLLLCVVVDLSTRDRETS